MGPARDHVADGDEWAIWQARRDRADALLARLKQAPRAARQRDDQLALLIGAAAFGRQLMMAIDGPSVAALRAQLGDDVFVFARAHGDRIAAPAGIFAIERARTCAIEEGRRLIELARAPGARVFDLDLLIGTAQRHLEAGAA